MPIHVFNTIKNLLKDENAKIGILGITYKPNIDDIRRVLLLN